MTTHSAIEAVKSATSGLTLEQVRELLVTLTEGSGASLVGEGGSPERTVNVALESTYSRLFAERHAGLSCTAIAAMSADLTDDLGFYVSRVAAAESNAVEYALIERRHPDMWDMDGMPSALVAAVAPCENH